MFVNEHPRAKQRFAYTPRLTFFEALRNQARVVRALTIREISERYGTEGLGYFWVIGEPMLLTFGVMLLWTILKNNHGGSVNLGLFALTGYSHVQLFRYCVFNASQSLSRSAWLAYHSNVHPLDVLIARSVMSSLGIFGSFVIGYFILFVFGLSPAPSSPLLIVSAWTLDTVFCFSFSLVVAGLSEISHIVEKLLHPVMYLTIPLTGVFSMTSWLPVAARNILFWSPLVSAVEMLRAGVFSEEIRTYWSVPVLVLGSLACLAVGLPLIALARRRAVVR